MANEMSTYVKIKAPKAPAAILDKLLQIFKPSKEGDEATAVDVINNIRGTSFTYKNENPDWDETKDFPNDDIWDDMIGPKWMYVYYEHGDNPENVLINIRSAWSVPVAFLQTLHSILSEIDNEIIIHGTYEDESYDPCGAFVYAGEDYDDIEDFDEVFDWDEYEEDDFYLENWHDRLFELENDLLAAYQEYLDDQD